MKHEGDSSIWKSLAVAFGDGLAFGVGVKIAQTAARGRQQGAEPAAELPQPVPAPAPASAPVAAAPPPAETLDLQMLSKVLASIDAKLVRHMGEVEQRLTASQAQIEETLGTRLRAYVDAHAETGEQALEERLRRQISEAGDRTAKLLVDTIEVRLLSRIAVLESEIRSLQALNAGSTRKLHDVLDGFSRACQDAMRELEQQETAPESGSGTSGGGGTAAAAAEADAPTDDRRFDSLKLVNYQGRAERKVPIPLVSSIAVFLLGMAALGSTAGWTF